MAYNNYRKIYQLLILVLVFLFSPHTVFASNFVDIKVFPENVGVFTSDGKQQFVAFGYLDNGTGQNITDLVEWKSSNNKIVTINNQGLATVVTGKTAGQVKISCSFPKTTKNPSESVPFLLNRIQLLLL